MNTRLRLLVIFLGALVVAATFTFNLWFPLLVNPADIVLFPELPDDLYTAFEALPAERRDAYLAQRDVDTALTARMVVAALRAQRVAPDDQQINPQRSGQVEVLTTEFIPITVNRSATGKITLYEMPDGSRYFWLEDFSAIPGDSLRPFLSAVDQEMLLDLEQDEDGPLEYRLTLDDFILDPLRYDVGNQLYEVPADADLSLYNSLIIYSQGFNLLWAYAEF